jgi:hypothetical protein
MPNLLEQAITSDDADQTATSIMTVNPSSEDLCGNCFTPLPATGGPCPKCGSSVRALQARAKLAGSSTLAAGANQIHTLDSASKYYLEILKPEYDEYFAAPATLRSAFNLVKNLFHCRDWSFEHHRTELEAHFGIKLASEAALWDAIDKLDGRFGFIRDVANASKHVRLTRRPSTSMSHIANTYIETGSFQSVAFQRSAFDTTRVRMKDGSQVVDFDDCARAFFQYWTDLFKQIGVIV